MEQELGFFFRIGVYSRQLYIFFRTLTYLKNWNLFLSQFITCALYFFRSPYRMIDKSTNPYGETPYFTLDHIAKNFGILSTDRILDMGCGRGLGVLFWNQRIKAESYGIDNYAPFIQRATWLKNLLSLDRVHFIIEDFFSFPLDQMTVIYLYGTCLSDEAIEKMIQRFAQLSTETKIITVSYPLSDFSSQFATEKEINGIFPWGRSPIYLNRKIED